MKQRSFSFSLASLAWALMALPAQSAINTILKEPHHLGVRDRPEWEIFEGKTPQSDKLRFSFESRLNLREYTLFIRQNDVKQEWSVTLNGKKLGGLFLMEEELIHTLAIPPNALGDGTNELEITPKTTEDIILGEIAIGDDSKEKLLIARAEVRVEDATSGELLPARITVVDANGTLVPIQDFRAVTLAARPGVVYSSNGRTELGLLPGKYTIYATRGPEYDMAVVHEFDPAADKSIALKLNRRASTPGWVASDTHIHTLSLSKHGDALLRERVITLAAEGIELPVSTEHNLHADYQPAAAELGVQKFFTLVSGNEVTTKKGHFNIFPVETNAAPPNAAIENWSHLLSEIRSTPKVQIAILNHPTDTHSAFTPFAATNVNLATGRSLRTDMEFTFDALELINSGAMRSDWMEPFRAWFALLNRGLKITGVGASDSHDISRFIVGQGRTYIRADDSDVSRIDIAKACESLKRGHAVVSLGLIAQMTLREAGSRTVAGPGDLLSGAGDELEAQITLDAPLAPGRTPHFTIYANGKPTLAVSALPQTDAHYVVYKRIQKPAYDTFYVLVATIDGNLAPAWGLARPYQPTSRRLDPRLIGATNPIWVDADGDFKFSSARDYAKELIASSKSIESLLTAVEKYGSEVAAHCAELLETQGHDLRALLGQCGPKAQEGFNSYLRAAAGEGL